MSLGDLQKEFQNFLFGKNTNIHTVVKGLDNEEVRARLHVYQNAYRVRILGVLKEEFNKLYLLLGEEDFAALVSDYLDATTFSSYSIRDVGAKFPEFIAKHTDYAKKPLLRALADFEWVFGQRLDAKDATPISLETLQNIAPEDWPRLTFTMHPALVVKEYRYNVGALWQALSESREYTSFEEEQLTYWALFRKDWQCYFVSLSENEQYFLELIGQEISFADICEAYIHRMPESEIPPFVLGQLQRWILNQCVVAIDVR